MNTVIWIDLDEAARLLSTGRNKVMCLIREGLLDSKRRRHAGIVVRATRLRAWPRRSMAGSHAVAAQRPSGFVPQV